MEKKEKREIQPPSLLIEYGPPDDLKHYLYSVSEKRLDVLTMSILCDKSIIPCNYGWLACQNPLTDACSLWNPESMEIIQLPELPQSCTYKQCVLSKPPTEPGCHILFKSASMYELAFCQIGDDEFVEMSVNDDEVVEHVRTLIPFRGNICALVGTTTPQLATISFVEKTLEFKPILKSGQPWLIHPSFRPWSFKIKHYMIKSPCNDDEMMLVCKIPPAGYLCQFSNFKIFRIDMNRLECVELVDICEQTIFLSNNGDAFCSSSVGLKSNSIYYTDRGRNLYVYNLCNKGTSRLLPCPAAHRLRTMTSWIDH